MTFVRSAKSPVITLRSCYSQGLTSGDLEPIFSRDTFPRRFRNLRSSYPSFSSFSLQAPPNFIAVIFDEGVTRVVVRQRRHLFSKPDPTASINNTQD